MTIVEFLEARLVDAEEWARNSPHPGWYLPDITAKRAIIERWRLLRAAVDADWDEMYKDGQHQAEALLDVYIGVFVQLSSAFADHADYDERWRPTTPNQPGV